MSEMDKAHQSRLMVGALKDYGKGLMPLGMLVQKIEGILAVMQDQSFKEKIFDALLALDEVHAVTQIGNFDFDKNGRSVVDHAIREIPSVTKTHLDRLE